MRNLITCLGFNPNNDGIIFPILEARLMDTIEFCKKNPGSLLILMGGSTFRNRNPHNHDQSILMKDYIEDRAPEILSSSDIILHNEASNTIRELCFLRRFVDGAGNNFKLTIVASEYFVERVKLCAEYILPHAGEINFIASAIPADNLQFRIIEQEKLVRAQEWLSGHQKGDYEAILADQDEFERQVITNVIAHPVSQ